STCNFPCTRKNRWVKRSLCVTQKVWFGDVSEVPLGVAKDASVTIPKGQMKNLKASYKLTQPTLEAPLAKNQVVGTIDFQLDGKTIEQHPLVVMHDQAPALIVAHSTVYEPVRKE
ncbi:hypothetical protein ISX56_34200, partial [Serratia ureilytica]|nr:hypothetical protein [Serratia ureilytica]